MMAVVLGSVRAQALHNTNPMAETQVIAYNRIAALTLLLYDIVLTLHQEIAMVWSSPWSLVKFVFLFIRYFSVASLISILFISNPLLTFTPQNCYICGFYAGLATLLIIFAVDYILLLRIFALYRERRIIRTLVACMYAVELVIMSVGVALMVPKLKYNDLSGGIVAINFPRVLIIVWVAPVLFQTILFSLTTWKFAVAVRAGWGNVPIIQLLMRDGTWAFFLLFTLMMAELIFFAIARKAYCGVLYGWLNITFAFCVGIMLAASLKYITLTDAGTQGYRILLNLNSLRHSARRTSRSTFVVDSDGVQVLTSRIYTGTVTQESQG